MDITPLNPIDAIRQRPAMYVGPVDSRGLHHLALMAFDEFVAERLSGSGTCISVRITCDGRLELCDDGRSAHLDPLDAFAGRSRFEIAFTHTQGAGDFRGPKKYHLGRSTLDTLSLVVVNALSEQFEVQSGDGQVTSTLRCYRGESLGALTHTPNKARGLRICFKPDGSIFSDTHFNQTTITSRLVELAALGPGIIIQFRDDRTNDQADFRFTDGASGLVRLVNASLKPAYNTIFMMNHAAETLQVSIAFQHVREAGCRAMTYVNSMLTSEGGTHWDGFVAGLEAVVAEFMDDEADGSASSITHEGLTAVVSIWLNDPTYRGATQNKLAEAQLYDAVKTIVRTQLAAQLTANPSLIDALLHRPRTAFLPIQQDWTLPQIKAAMSQPDSSIASIT